MTEREAIVAYLRVRANKQIDDQSAVALLNVADEIEAGAHMDADPN